MSDLNVRAGVIFTDGEMCLIGHAPNKKMGDNTWDLPKGHLKDNGESPLEGAAREFTEETGMQLDTSNIKLINEQPVKYGKDLFYLAMAKVVTLPPLESYHCESFFDWYGKKLPEVSTFKYIPIDELGTYIYKGLADVVVPMLDSIIEKTSDFSDEEVALQESFIYKNLEKI